MKRLSIGSGWITLGDALKLAGFCDTGGQAKLAVQQGLVQVNGEVCLQRGKKLHAGDGVRMGEKEFRIV